MKIQSITEIRFYHILKHPAKHTGYANSTQLSIGIFLKGGNGTLAARLQHTCGTPGNCTYCCSYFVFIVLYIIYCLILIIASNS